MSSHNLTGHESAELFDKALATATVDPVLQSDDYWMYVRALQSRSDRAVFDQALSLCSGQDPLTRAVGADVLAQLGTHAGIEEYPFADESASVLISLLSDSDTRVV